MYNITKTTDVPTKKNRILYLDYLRVFSTIAVITLHISAQNWHSSDVTTFQWQLFNLLDSITRWCVSLFVMISGALFLNRTISIKVIYTKYILRLVSAALFWGFLYALLIGGTPMKILIYTIKGRYHLWFIPMIIGVYICIPIIKKIIESWTLTKYFLIIAFVFAFIMPQITIMVNDFGCTFLQELVDAVNTNLDDMALFLPLGYTSHFILGYYLDKIDLTKRQQHIVYVFGIAGFAFTICASSFLSLKSDVPRGVYYDDFTVNVLLESIFIFVIFKYRCAGTNLLNKLIVKMSNYSFGAYLVHIMILEALEKAGLNTLTLTPIVSIPIILVCTASLSFFISAIIHRIPIFKKYIV